MLSLPGYGEKPLVLGNGVPLEHINLLARTALEFGTASVEFSLKEC